MNLFFRSGNNPETPRPSLSRGFLLSTGIVILVAAAGALFLMGFRYGQKFPETIVVRGVSNIEGETPADFGTFWQAWKTLEEEYLRYEEVSDQDKVYGAVQGLVGSLGDPYSQFFPPSESRKFEEDIQGNFGGIGAELGIRDGGVVVIAPLKETPAERAGLRSGDKIYRVNSSSTDGITIDEAVSWIRGPKGTSVTLTVFREEWQEPREVKIVRDLIEVPTLEFEMKDDGIAYIQLYSFNANAEQLFYDAAVKIISQKARGIVLDLRNNPGGYLEVAVDLAGWFVPDGSVVVTEENRNGTSEVFKARGNHLFEKMPVVVLQNGGSASASEILAGALRDLRKAKLVGEKSFGKGTVQQLFPLRDESSLKLTIAHWVLPSGEIIDGKGLVPDAEVEISDEDIENERDPQLDRAIELLKQEIR